MNGKKPFSMIREFHLADWFTLGNAFCGMASVFSAMAFLQSQQISYLLIAAGFIPAALIFDIFDGRIARWRQEQSALGRELDSLADVISFGVAPAVIAYSSGMHGLWDALILVCFVACGVSRLARYNITAEAMSETSSGKVKFFEGTPIPSSTLLVVVLAIAAAQGRIDDALWFGQLQLGPGLLHPLVLMFALSGSLMVSTIRIPKL